MTDLATLFLDTVSPKWKPFLLARECKRLGKTFEVDAFTAPIDQLNLKSVDYFNCRLASYMIHLNTTRNFRKVESYAADYCGHSKLHRFGVKKMRATKYDTPEKAVIKLAEWFNKNVDLLDKLVA